MSLGNVLSGKGGVGKSSITTQLALSLCLAGHSVGILDVDLTGPSIPRLLGVEGAKITQAPGGWLPVEVHPSQILPPLPYPPPKLESGSVGTSSTESNGNASNGASLPETQNPERNGAPHPPRQATIGSLHIMSLGFLLPSRSSAVVWRGPKKTAMVRQFLTDVLWPPNTDYLLIDTPPGTSDEHISLAETLLSPPNNHNNSSSHRQLAGALIVTTPQAVSVSDVRKELNFCRKVGVDVLGVVENLAGYVCECCGVSTNVFGRGGGEVMSQEFEVPFLGRVPVDAQWGALVEEGRRPRYGGAEKSAGGDEESGGGDKNRNGADGMENGAKDENRAIRKPIDPGPLVDKYRSCSLHPIFAGIANELAQKLG
ncbi:cytosolic Fe-S cluster assembly factor cfd1 [Lobaria immixta]|nr:cytosolic Fe-S cluster assembly factor cfd1 [Lobaria immixta]